MNYWFDVDITRNKVTSDIFEYRMIDQTKNKKPYPNINKIKTGDKVIFVKSLVCYADGIIKKFNFNSNHSGNRTDPYPINIEYDVKVWKKDVPLREQEVIDFLAKVRFENSKYGTFLRDSNEDTIKNLSRRLASEFQRINKEIFDYLRKRGANRDL